MYSRGITLIEIVYTLIVISVLSYLMVDIFSSTIRMENGIKDDIRIISKVNSCLEDELSELNDVNTIYDRYVFINGTYEIDYDVADGIRLIVVDQNKIVGDRQLIEIRCVHSESGVTQNVKKYVQ